MTGSGHLGWSRAAHHRADRSRFPQGFYPDVAPETVAHILEVAKLGGYNTNHFFRVDKGFVAQARPPKHRGRRLPRPPPIARHFARLQNVCRTDSSPGSPRARPRPPLPARARPLSRPRRAQVADVIGGRTTPLNEHQSRVGALTVPGEFSKASAPAATPFVHQI